MTYEPYAFPGQPYGSDGLPSGYHEFGMTLRDWFAGQALAGYFAHPTTPHMHPTDAGAYCYAMADAMLAERAKGGAA